MMSIRMIASAMFAAGAHIALAQSTPTPPAAPQPQTLKAPPSSPPPPRPAAILPASQRTPTAPLSLKAAPNAALVRAAAPNVRTDSARVASTRTSTAAIAAAAPAARVENPPRRAKTAAALSATINAAEARPIGATMRCKDGTYLTGTVSGDRCASNGGVAVTYPATTTPAPPRPQPQKRP